MEQIKEYISDKIAELNIEAESATGLTNYQRYYAIKDHLESLEFIYGALGLDDECD